VPRASLIAVLAASIFAGACTSTSAHPSGISPTGGDATTSIDPCSLLPRALVAATLPGAVTQVRKLTADNFLSPPPSDRVACAYETNGRLGQLIVSTEPMGRSEYEARYITRNLFKTSKVANVGEDARLSGCQDLTVYSNGRVLQLGFQFLGNRGACRALVSLGRAALRQL